jgi:hypothetical protein
VRSLSHQLNCRAGAEGEKVETSASQENCIRLQWLTVLGAVKLVKRSGVSKTKDSHLIVNVTE